MKGKNFSDIFSNDILQKYWKESYIEQTGVEYLISQTNIDNLVKSLSSDKPVGYGSLFTETRDKKYSFQADQRLENALYSAKCASVGLEDLQHSSRDIQRNKRALNIPYSRQIDKLKELKLKVGLMIEAWVQKTTLLKSKRGGLDGNLDGTDENLSLLERCQTYLSEKTPVPDQSFLGSLTAKTMELWVQDVIRSLSNRKLEQIDCESLVELNSQLSKVVELFLETGSAQIEEKWVELDDSIKDSIGRVGKKLINFISSSAQHELSPESAKVLEDLTLTTLKALIVKGSLSLHFRFVQKLKNTPFYKALLSFEFPDCYRSIVAMVPKEEIEFSLVDKELKKITVPEQYDRRNQYLFGNQAFLICNSLQCKSKVFAFNTSDQLKKELICYQMRDNIQQIVDFDGELYALQKNNLFRLNRDLTVGEKICTINPISSDLVENADFLYKDFRDHKANNMQKSDFQAVFFKDGDHLWVLTEHKFKPKGGNQHEVIFSVDLHQIMRDGSSLNTKLLKRSLLTIDSKGSPFSFESEKENLTSFLASSSYFRCEPSLPQLVGLSSHKTVLILDFESASVVRQQTFKQNLTVGVDAAAGRCIMIDSSIDKLAVHKYFVRNFSHELQLAKLNKETILGSRPSSNEEEESPKSESEEDSEETDLFSIVKNNSSIFEKFKKPKNVVKCQSSAVTNDQTLKDIFWIKYVSYLIGFQERFMQDLNLKCFTKLESINEEHDKTLEQTEQQRQLKKDQEHAFFQLVKKKKNLGLERADPFFNVAFKNLDEIWRTVSDSEEPLQTHEKLTVALVMHALMNMVVSEAIFTEEDKDKRSNVKLIIAQCQELLSKVSTNDSRSQSFLTPLASKFSAEFSRIQAYLELEKQHDIVLIKLQKVFFNAKQLGYMDMRLNYLELLETAKDDPRVAHEFANWAKRIVTHAIEEIVEMKNCFLKKSNIKELNTVQRSNDLKFMIVYTDLKLVKNESFEIEYISAVEQILKILTLELNSMRSEVIIIQMENFKQESECKQLLANLDELLKGSLIGQVSSMCLASSLNIKNQDSAVSRLLLSQEIRSKMKNLCICLVETLNVFGEYVKNEESFSSVSSVTKEFEIEFTAQTAGNEVEHSVECVLLEPREQLQLRLSDDSVKEFNSGLKIEIYQNVSTGNSDSTKKILTQVIDWSNCYKKFKLDQTSKLYIIPRISSSLSQSGGGKIKICYTQTNSRSSLHESAFVNMMRLSLMSFLELTPTLEMPSYFKDEVLGYKFTEKDLENMEGILSSELCSNGLDFGTILSKDYNIEVEGLSLFQIANEYKQSIYLGCEIFDEEQQKFEDYCETLQVMVEFSNQKYSVAGNLGFQTTVMLFITVLKQTDLFEIVKLGLMYDQSPLGPEYVEMWKICSKTRFLTWGFQSEGELGSLKFKEMLRKLKFLHSLEKGESMDFNDFDNSANQRQDAEPRYTPEQLTEVIEITQEFFKNSQPILSDKSIAKLVILSEKFVNFLHTGFTLDMLDQVLSQKQTAFEAVNSRVEVFDMFMMNIKGSTVSESLYQTFQELIKQEIHSIGSLTYQYAGLPSYFVPFQYSSLEKLFNTMIWYIEQKSSSYHEIFNCFKYQFQATEISVLKTIDISRLINVPDDENKIMITMDHIFELFQLITSFYTKLINPLPHQKSVDLADKQLETLSKIVSNILGSVCKLLFATLTEYQKNHICHLPSQNKDLQDSFKIDTGAALYKEYQRYHSLLEQPILRIIYLLLQFPGEILRTFITQSDWMKNGIFQGKIGDRLQELWKALDQDRILKTASDYNFAALGRHKLPSDILFFKNWQLDVEAELGASDIECYQALLNYDSHAIEIAPKSGLLVKVNSHDTVDWEDIHSNKEKIRHNQVAEYDDEIDFVREFEQEHDEISLQIFNCGKSCPELKREGSQELSKSRLVYKNLLINSEDEMVNSNWTHDNLEASDFQNLAFSKQAKFFQDDKELEESDLLLRDYINSNRLSDEELFGLAAFAYGLDQDHEEFFSNSDSQFFKKLTSAELQQSKLELNTDVNWRVKIVQDGSSSENQNPASLLKLEALDAAANQFLFDQNTHDPIRLFSQYQTIAPNLQSFTLSKDIYEQPVAFQQWYLPSISLSQQFNEGKEKKFSSPLKKSDYEAVLQGRGSEIENFIKEGVLYAVVVDNQGNSMVRHSQIRIRYEVIPKKLYITECGHLLNLGRRDDKSLQGKQFFQDCITKIKTLSLNQFFESSQKLATEKSKPLFGELLPVQVNVNETSIFNVGLINKLGDLLYIFDKSRKKLTIILYNTSAAPVLKEIMFRPELGFDVLEDTNPQGNMVLEFYVSGELKFKNIAIYQQKMIVTVLVEKLDTIDTLDIQVPNELKFTKYQKNIADPNIQMVVEALDSLDEEDSKILENSSWTVCEKSQTQVEDIVVKPTSQHYNLMLFPDLNTLKVGQFRKMIDSMSPYLAKNSFDASMFKEAFSKILNSQFEDLKVEIDGEAINCLFDMDEQKEEVHEKASVFQFMTRNGKTESEIEPDIPANQSELLASIALRVLNDIDVKFFRNLQQDSEAYRYISTNPTLKEEDSRILLSVYKDPGVSPFARSPRMHQIEGEVVVNRRLTRYDKYQVKKQLSPLQHTILSSTPILSLNLLAEAFPEAISRLEKVMSMSAELLVLSCETFIVQIEKEDTIPLCKGGRNLIVMQVAIASIVQFFKATEQRPFPQNDS